jgi:uncharacterized protein
MAERSGQSMKSRIETAIGGHRQVPVDWMPATGAEALLHEDPALIWLKYYGEKHGFQPDSSPYDFLDFVAEKGRQFESKWREQVTPRAVQACARAGDARSADKVRETFALMQKGTPVITRAALWWAPERIYGVADLLVHTSWLARKFPRLLARAGKPRNAPGLGNTGGHYVVFDLKFTSGLESQSKAKALAGYAAQVRIYAYMLGQIQGAMPGKGYLISRDRILDPLPIEITSIYGRPLDKDLSTIRNQFVEIKVNGARYLPWRNAVVSSNLSHRNERWRTAKGVIAREKVPGRDPGILYQVGPRTKRELARNGFATLDSLLEADPATIPFERYAGLGPAKAKRIRAILEANRSGSPVGPRPNSIPLKTQFEFYVDFEYFTNVNVDFDRQWPTLEGCEMLFLIGVGWEDEGKWLYQTFITEAEDQAQERVMVGQFVDFLREQTGGALLDRARTSLYHWTVAEDWQSRRASDRHGLPQEHPLRRLPWVDLQKVFLDAPVGVPGAWTFQLKEIAKSLGKLDAQLDPGWPGELDQGLRAMVMGWKAYQGSVPPRWSKEMEQLKLYLEADCKALWKILQWMRS